jgi:hypothetical protein
MNESEVDDEQESQVVTQEAKEKAKMIDVPERRKRGRQKAMAALVAFIHNSERPSVHNKKTTIPTCTTWIEL